jgi:hypothetical protein
MHQHGSIPFGAAAAAVPTSYPKVAASLFLRCTAIASASASFSRTLPDSNLVLLVRRGDVTLASDLNAHPAIFSGKTQSTQTNHRTDGRFPKVHAAKLKISGRPQSQPDTPFTQHVLLFPPRPRDAPKPARENGPPLPLPRANSVPNPFQSCGGFFCSISPYNYCLRRAPGRHLNPPRARPPNPTTLPPPTTPSPNPHTPAAAAARTTCPTEGLYQPKCTW